MSDKRWNIIEEAGAITSGATGGPILKYASAAVEQRIAPIKESIPIWLSQLEGVDQNIEIYFVSEEEMQDFSQFFENLPEEYKNHLNYADLKNQAEGVLPAACHSFDTDNDGKKDFALIQISALENVKHLNCAYVLARQLGVEHDVFQTKESFMAFYNGLPPDIIASIDQIPGTDQDWDLAILAHELGHLGHKQGGLIAEQFADQFMVDQLAKQGIISEGVVETDVAFRALKSIFSFEGIPHFLVGTDYTHVTNVGVHSYASDRIIPYKYLVTNEDKLKLLEFLAGPFCYGESGLMKRPSYMQTDSVDQTVLESAIYEIKNIQAAATQYDENSLEWVEVQNKISDIITQTVSNLTDELEQIFHENVEDIASYKYKISLYAVQDKIILGSLGKIGFTEDEKNRILDYLEEAHKTSLRTLKQKTQNTAGSLDDIEMHFSYIDETAETIQEDQQIVQMIRNGDISFEDGLSILNNFGHMTYDFSKAKNGNVLRQIMQEKLGINPPLVYEILAQLYQNENLQGDRHQFDTFFQQQYAYEFLQAAQLFPTVFHVPESMPEFQKPAMEDTLPLPAQPEPIQIRPAQPPSIGSIGTFKQ